MSWKWEEKYLPPNIHAERKTFQDALGLLHEYKFADCNEGTLAVLGFGLLLRECWRAVEIEDDDEKSPGFLQTSLLGHKQVKQVVKVIKEAIDTLPSPDANKELERQEGRKLAKGKGPAYAQVPSTSKPSGMDEVSSQVDLPQSQRKRKPSKKLHNSKYG